MFGFGNDDDSNVSHSKLAGGGQTDRVRNCGDDTKFSAFDAFYGIKDV